jgi:hypothetical protein
MIRSMDEIPSIANYLKRIGAEPRSLRVAVVKISHGAYWTDIATVRIQPDGSVMATAGYEPTGVEAAQIKTEVLAAKWPGSTKLGKGFELPEELKSAASKDIFELKDAQGNLLMIQQRVNDRKTGDKRYVPWSPWDDGEWRKAEPEGPLPLYGLETIQDHTTVFVHEGAKAAKAVRDLVNPRTEAEREALAAHPWGAELSGAAHIGWIGGALSPARTDWSELSRAGVQRVYIVADNDEPGKTAIPRISERLQGMTVFSIEFTENWPAGFDLADEFPKSMFTKMGKHTHYSGPTFRDVLHPATWATDMHPNPSGKGAPIAVLRKEFANLWVWIEETDSFVCREMPEINHQIGMFNAMIRPFSHVAATGQLIQKTYKGRTARVCYRPDIKARMVTDRTTSAINLHTPSTIKPIDGDEGPWLDFLKHVFPVERERKEIMRWCATLIARPEIRMLYGILLYSERQGMGKSTLGEKILAPLVGLQNTGFPGERDIVESSFNGWVAKKRLIVVGEIYTGQSFKAYNILKSYITDKNINVNEKFERPYTIENWTHMLACSNSKKALRIEETDRRWFYPRLNETPWDRKQWGEFLDWLGSGGLGIIARWANEYGDYVMEGEHAPMTASKKSLIEDSKGEVVTHWVDVMEAVESEEEDVVFAISEVRDAMRSKHGRIYETPHQFRKEAISRGWYTTDVRVKIDGSYSFVVVSPKYASEIMDMENAEDSEIRAKLNSKLSRLSERIKAF